MSYETRIVDRELVAERTLAFQLARPEGFEFSAGQYVDVSLVDPPFTDAQGSMRSLSIASAPHEEALLFVVRLRDTAFKRSLASIRLGEPVRFDGPVDDIVLPTTGDRPLALIAGGVGIASFLSPLREAARAGTPLPATLFYSNRRPEDAAFLGELVDLARRIPGFRFVPTMTSAVRSRLPWHGETSRIDARMLARHLPALRGPRWYISGSTAFISALRQELEGAGVPRADLWLEMYCGY